MNASNIITHSAAVEILKSHPKVSTPDIAKCFNPKSISHLSPQTVEYACSMGVSDWDGLLLNKQKQVMRGLQFLNAVHQQKYSGLDYTHARIICALHLAGGEPLCTDAIQALTARVISPTANTRGITRSALDQMYRYSHGLTTVQAKISNSTGVNGFLNHLGVTAAVPGERNHAVYLNDESPLTRAFLAMINKATKGQIEEMLPKGAE